jgi:hypothetical protein
MEMRLSDGKSNQGRGWKSGGPGRVACGDSADSMLRFRLKR